MKLLNKRNLLLATTMFFFTGTAFAENPVCGEAQDDSWMSPDVVQEQIKALGYTIDSMDISDGNCYQMTGLNNEGKGVTAFIDPRTGGVVQESLVE